MMEPFKCNVAGCDWWHFGDGCPNHSTDLDVGDKVLPVSGSWSCGCDDTEGTVSELGEMEDGPAAFVGTPCFWEWIPLSGLRKAGVR